MGVSLMTPNELALVNHSLPITLHKLYARTTSSYSKAPRGLFVLVWVDRIFAAIAISPSPLLKTVLSSLRLSCRSELTRQGISVP